MSQLIGWTLQIDCLASDFSSADINCVTFTVNFTISVSSVLKWDNTNIYFIGLL